MLTYKIDSRVEAFSTERKDNMPVDVVVPTWQAHGDKSAMVPCDMSNLYGVDALITTTPGLTIGVRTADCVPILVYDPTIPAVAAIHSGWRGTLLNICGKTIKRIADELGGSPTSMQVVIGPCIKMPAFEVGNEVAEQFISEGYKSFMEYMTMPGKTEVKWHIDLPNIIVDQLGKAGVEKVEVRPECTYESSERFFSSRVLGASLQNSRIYNCICFYDN